MVSVSAVELGDMLGIVDGLARREALAGASLSEGLGRELGDSLGVSGREIARRYTVGGVGFCCRARIYAWNCR